MEKAPFFASVADAPDGGEIAWIRAADGVRLRIAIWPEGSRGTVLMFPGRTEFVEKYGPSARELARRGYAMIAVDWRGQGLADRSLADRNVGHVGAFAEFQRDVDAVVAAARARGLPQPWFLIGHSMGGCIGLRAVYEGLPVRAAAFSAPMWGIRMSALMRPVAWALSGAGTAIGLGGRYVPGMNGVTYVHSAAYEGNVLSSDAAMFAYMKRQVTDHPDLSIGGPSLRWLYAALRECRDLARKPSPDLPCHCAVGPAERVVDIAAIENRMARWPGASFDRIEGAEHEIMMEQPPIRARFYDAATRLFDAQPR